MIEIHTPNVEGIDGGAVMAGNASAAIRLNCRARRDRPALLSTIMTSVLEIVIFTVQGEPGNVLKDALVKVNSTEGLRS